MTSLTEGDVRKLVKTMRAGLEEAIETEALKLLPCEDPIDLKILVQMGRGEPKGENQQNSECIVICFEIGGIKYCIEMCPMELRA